MIKNIEDFKDSKEINSPSKRIVYYNDNKYRFDDELHIFDDVINAGINDLAKMKLYLIAEDTCFDYLGLKYDENMKKVMYPDGTQMSLSEFYSMIDTYRHTYISAIYTHKYGVSFTKIITDTKEILDLDNPIADHIKDFNNNAIGRQIGKNIYNLFPTVNLPNI